MLQINTLKKDLYEPGDDLLAAINTALFLQRPLLLSGDPGTGKTECADFIARQLKHAHPDKFNTDSALRFNTKSISQATDLFYQYDAVAHFGDKEGRKKENFISFDCLGIALLATHGQNENWHHFQNYESDVVNGNLGFGSVVLIDEIDKAPRDFPNDLLAELEKPPFKFSIKELTDFKIEQKKEKPIVIVITSNNEKGLPDAFLRRCVFHHINFPGPKTLLRIIESKLRTEDPYFEDAIAMFMLFRNKKDINKPAATSELIDWISCLKEKQLLNSDLKNWQAAGSDYRKKIVDTLGIIAKNRSDFNSIKKELEGS